MKTCMKKISKIFTFFLLTLISTQALAIIEARLSYGLNASKLDLAEFYTGNAATAPSATPLYGMGGDLLFNVPMMDWGVGARYENLGLKASNGPLEFSASLNRTAVVGFYRFINTVLFLGPIATFGLSHKGEMDVSVSDVKQSSFSSTESSSYSLGLEGGIRLVGFVIGAELGTLSCKFSKVSDSGTAALGTKDLDMSSTYSKIFVGFSF